MNKREACQWVHARMIVDELPADDLEAAFTALVGHVPKGSDRREGLFRRCYEIVTSMTGVSDELQFTPKKRAVRPSAS